ncbi:MAG: hypothetical protein GXY42_02430 [Desulfovibrionales bacterium]|nr:hypothetical protein [Desulfovibrionales bacterium]
MLELEGAHGTTASRAESISRSGFRLGSFALWGEGVYFFHRQPEGQDEAKKWYRKSLQSGSYNSDEDKSCIVIYAFIRLNEENFFDVLHPEVVPVYNRLLDEIRGRKYSSEQKNFIRDKWLRGYEQIQGKPIKVFCSSIPVPEKIFKPNREAKCIAKCYNRISF